MKPAHARVVGGSAHRLGRGREAGTDVLYSVLNVPLNSALSQGQMSSSRPHFISRKGRSIGLSCRDKTRPQRKMPSLYLNVARCCTSHVATETWYFALQGRNEMQKRNMPGESRSLSRASNRKFGIVKQTNTAVAQSRWSWPGIFKFASPCIVQPAMLRGDPVWINAMIERFRHFLPTHFQRAKCRTAKK
jgi:hypothetical protein